METRALVELVTEVRGEVSNECQLTARAYERIKSSLARAEGSMKTITECMHVIESAQEQGETLANSPIGAQIESIYQYNISQELLDPEYSPMTRATPEHAGSFDRILPDFSYPTAHELRSLSVSPFQANPENWDWLVQSDKRATERDDLASAPAKDQSVSVVKAEAAQRRTHVEPAHLLKE